MRCNVSNYKKKFLQKLLIATIVIFFCNINIIFSQIPQFSQFYAAPMHLAPSFTGGTDGSRASLNYRNQWPEIPGVFITFAFAFDHYFDQYNSGVGVMFFRDQAGDANLATTNAGLLYSYNFKINRDWIFRPGLHFIYTQRSIDYNRFLFGDQLNLEGNIINTANASYSFENVSYFDAAASLLAYRNNLWLGVSIDHLMTPNQSLSLQESRVPYKISAFSGYVIPLNSRSDNFSDDIVTITGIYKKQANFNQFDIGGYWTKDPVSLGLLYRGVIVFDSPVYDTYNHEAIVLIAALRRENIRIGYSYDFTISNLLGSTGGSHEISVIFQFNQGRAGKTHCFHPCVYSPYD